MDKNCARSKIEKKEDREYINEVTVNKAKEERGKCGELIRHNRAMKGERGS